MSLIGVIGGVGPYAGLKLVEYIFENTIAASDQEHVPLCLLNLPMIPDRSRYLMYPDTEPHPKDSILDGIAQLELLNASVCAIPCNTAHSPDIINPVLESIRSRRYRIRFIHLVRESLLYLINRYPAVQRVGLLSTEGTYLSKVYPSMVETISSEQGQRRLSILIPPEQKQRLEVHDSVYNSVFGIKAQSSPIDPRAIDILRKYARQLQEQGAEAIILGCTEISLAGTLLGLDIPFIDPLYIVARSLLQETYPERLRPDV